MMIRLILLALLCAVPSQDQKGLTIYWVDTEGGAATLIIAPSGESLLVDSGNPGKRDAERIFAVATRVAGLKRIDHHLVTHWHSDHFGGIGTLAGLIPVRKYYDHGFPGPEAKDVDARLKETYLKITQGKAALMKPDDTIPLEGVSIRVLSANALTPGEAPGSPQTRACSDHPAQPDDTSDNVRSVGFLLKFGDFDFLDVGDLTWNAEHKLVCPKNLIGPVDVYQVTHHGQANSNNPCLIRAVEPTVAIMNNGPKKGGKAPVVKILKETKSIQDLFALHRNVETGPEDNAAPALTANDEAACSGEWVRLQVAPDGKTFTVEVPSKKTKKSYTSR